MRFPLRILGLLVLVVFSSACSEKSGKPAPASIPVIVSTVIQKTVPVQIRAIGNDQAYSTVTVKAKVGGELVRVHFTEGQDVKKGDLLFTIDPRPFEAALKQAEANLQRDIAQAKHAREDAQRYESLIQKGVVPQQQYDKFRTDAEETSEISYFSSNIDLTHMWRTTSADLTWWEKRWNPGDAQLFDSASFL